MGRVYDSRCGVDILDRVKTNRIFARGKMRFGRAIDRNRKYAALQKSWAMLLSTMLWRSLTLDLEWQRRCRNFERGICYAVVGIYWILICSRLEKLR